MRDCLPLKPHYYECGVVNLDNHENSGTHWVAYIKKGDYCVYFDSFGDLRPPEEFVRYMSKHVVNIEYNYTRVQKFNTKNCGHLCLAFLCNTVKSLFK